MALIKCPECGKEISDKAGSCPGCGCPIGVTENVSKEKKDQSKKTRYRDFSSKCVGRPAID